MPPWGWESTATSERGISRRNKSTGSQASCEERRSTYRPGKLVPARRRARPLSPTDSTRFATSPRRTPRWYTRPCNPPRIRRLEPVTTGCKPVKSATQSPEPPRAGSTQRIAARTVEANGAGAQADVLRGRWSAPACVSTTNPLVDCTVIFRESAGGHVVRDAGLMRVLKVRRTPAHRVWEGALWVGSRGQNVCCCSQYRTLREQRCGPGPTSALCIFLNSRCHGSIGIRTSCANNLERHEDGACSPGPRSWQYRRWHKLHR